MSRSGGAPRGNIVDLDPQVELRIYKSDVPDAAHKKLPTRFVEEIKKENFDDTLIHDIIEAAKHEWKIVDTVRCTRSSSSLIRYYVSIIPTIRSWFCFLLFGCFSFCWVFACFSVVLAILKLRNSNFVSKFAGHCRFTELRRICDRFGCAAPQTNRDGNDG